MRDSVVSDPGPGRPLQRYDAGLRAPPRGELMSEEKASDPFEERHNGAASLGIP